MHNCTNNEAHAVYHNVRNNNDCCKHMIMIVCLYYITYGDVYLYNNDFYRIWGDKK